MPLVEPFSELKPGWPDSGGARLSQGGWPLAGPACEETSGQTLGRFYSLSSLFKQFQFQTFKGLHQPFLGDRARKAAVGTGAIYLYSQLQQ